MSRRVIAGERRASPAGDRPHCVAKLVGAGVLEQEAAGTGAECFVDVVVEVEGGQDEDVRGAVRGGDPPCRFDPVEARHPAELAAGC